MLDVLGPLGNGFQLPASGKVLLIGGGIGTAPLLFAAKSAPEGAVAALGFRTGAGANSDGGLCEGRDPSGGSQ